VTVTGLSATIFTSSSACSNLGPRRGVGWLGAAFEGRRLRDTQDAECLPSAIHGVLERPFRATEPSRWIPGAYQLPLMQAVLGAALAHVRVVVPFAARVMV
jgi:hypothetical protein